MQIDSQDLTAIAAMDEAAAKSTNGNVIAFAVGGAMLAVGAGLGYIFGNRRGVKKGEETMKASMSPEMESLRTSVSELKDAITPAK